MSLHDTVYPRLKQTAHPDELEQMWTPTVEEQRWVQSLARGPVAQFGLIATLKTFQRLGYFVALADLPQSVWDHLVQTWMPRRSRADLLRYDRSGTRWRHQREVRSYLHVDPWGGCPKLRGISLAYPFA